MSRTSQKKISPCRVVALRNREMDDRALVSALKAHRPGAMELMYDRHAPHVQRVLTRVLGVDAALPGLLHEVFIEAFSHIQSIKDGGRLKAWLTSIAVFTARGFIRKRSKNHGLWFGDPLLAPELPGVTANHEIREALACTYQLLDTLPTDERIAFALRFLEGMELTEVAEASRVSLATVKRRLARAKKRFYARSIDYPVLREWIGTGEKWGVK